MRSTRHERPARTCAAAALALLAGVLGVQGTARAEGCAAGHGMRPVVAQLELLTRSGALDLSEDRPARIPIAPCAGLRCSSRDSIPSPPSAPAPTLRPECW